MLAALSSLALLAGAVLGSPINLVDISPRSLDHYNPNVTIHESCNSTQRRMLEQALADTYEVAEFAKEYIVAQGPQDPVFQLYFGNETASYATVLGIWDALLHSDKPGVLLRCDDIDGNCHQPGWRGHWRGENGTSETVICDASYVDRKFNLEFCMHGFRLDAVKPAFYWSIDLIHRLFHVPSVTNGLVDHFAEDLHEVVELAAHNGTFAAVDSNALQYFAAHVYAIEVAKGGDACIGDIRNAPSSSGDAHAAASSAPSATDTQTASQQPGSSPSQTATAAAECHTHSDGVVHCT
ncbi:putative peptidase family-domain-containing protein [Papiliotrema laurentii]|uniref:Peptidase family-domain-containing protein n=1 Tax=Papiliotrema laurentii TaxID=5418 RepID=A0AAD9CVL1_PAPLA|nr:putative peptidase family-domain-containing protein [Papiliotrema laurentii]